MTLCYAPLTKIDQSWFSCTCILTLQLLYLGLAFLAAAKFRSRSADLASHYAWSRTFSDTSACAVDDANVYSTVDMMRTHHCGDFISCAAVLVSCLKPAWLFSFATCKVNLWSTCSPRTSVRFCSLRHVSGFVWSSYDITRTAHVLSQHSQLTVQALHDELRAQKDLNQLYRDEYGAGKRIDLDWFAGMNGDTRYLRPGPCCCFVKYEKAFLLKSC